MVTAASVITVVFCCGVLLKRMLPVRYVAILRTPLLAGAIAGWVGFAAARHAWLPGAAGSTAAMLLDFVLRAGFVCAIYAGAFVALDWKELASLARRAR